MYLPHTNSALCQAGTAMGQTSVCAVVSRPPMATMSHSQYVTGRVSCHTQDASHLCTEDQDCYAPLPAAPDGPPPHSTTYMDALHLPIPPLRLPTLARCIRSHLLQSLQSHGERCIPLCCTLAAMCPQTRNSCCCCLTLGPSVLLQANTPVLLLATSTPSAGSNNPAHGAMHTQPLRQTAEQQVPAGCCCCTAGARQPLALLPLTAAAAAPAVCPSWRMVGRSRWISVRRSGCCAARWSQSSVGSPGTSELPPC